MKYDISLTVNDGITTIAQAFLDGKRVQIPVAEWRSINTRDLPKGRYESIYRDGMAVVRLLDD